MNKAKGPQQRSKITCVIIATTLHHIWSARNHKIFKQKQITAAQSVYLIKEKLRARILFLNSSSKKNNRYTESILN